MNSRTAKKQKPRATVSTIKSFSVQNSASRFPKAGQGVEEVEDSVETDAAVVAVASVTVATAEAPDSTTEMVVVSEDEEVSDQAAVTDTARPAVVVANVEIMVAQVGAAAAVVIVREDPADLSNDPDHPRADDRDFKKFYRPQKSAFALSLEFQIFS